MKPGHSAKFAHYLRAHIPADDGAPPPWKVLYLPDGLQPTAPMAGGASGSVSGKRDGYQSGPRMTQCAASTPSDALRADATLMAVWEMTTAVMRSRESRREWVHGWLIEHKARPVEPGAPYHGDLYVTPPETVAKIEASTKRKREVTGGHNSSLRSRSALLSVLERLARGEWWEQPAKGAMVEVEVNDEENETVCWRAARVIDVQVDGRFKVHVQVRLPSVPASRPMLAADPDVVLPRSHALPCTCRRRTGSTTTTSRSSSASLLSRRASSGDGRC